MLEELEVLKIVSERLEAAQLPFVLTGSFAMAYYGKPRMTRDLDIPYPWRTQWRIDGTL
jgi:hypothetical protein